jgi:predicted metalloprotease with PDZ domain
MNYTIKIIDAKQHFVKIIGYVDYVHQDIVVLQLPAWRPGRYQLANYAKNIRKFEVFNAKRQTLTFKKLAKDAWEIDTKGQKSFWFQYEYYANQYDAGASFVNNEQLYINPVNCFMYLRDKQDEPFTVKLLVPENYQIACQLPVKDFTLYAGSFDELADSPFIASAQLQHHAFNFNQSIIHFWFMGKHPFYGLALQQLQNNTLAYATFQSKIFGEFPCANYHFMYHIMPTPFRHGVEHANSTVINLGFLPDTFLPEFTDDLLAISSHELFHLWNIKRLRPADMWPYDFTKENYSTLGYVYEGVTTYYGDLALLRSGVWDFNTYAAGLSSDLTKHYNNEGRFNYSLAESSFDTWLDGYEPGIPGRKVSIYIEGCLAALVADILILNHTGGKHRLDDALRLLYNQCFKQHKGYNEADYKQALTQVSGYDFTNYFNDLIHGKGMWDKYLQDALELIGCALHFAVKENQVWVTIKKLAEPTLDQQKLFEIWAT